MNWFLVFGIFLIGMGVGWQAAFYTYSLQWRVPEGYSVQRIKSRTSDHAEADAVQPPVHRPGRRVRPSLEDRQGRDPGEG